MPITSSEHGFSVKSTCRCSAHRNFPARALASPEALLLPFGAWHLVVAVRSIASFRSEPNISVKNFCQRSEQGFSVMSTCHSSEHGISVKSSCQRQSTASFRSDAMLRTATSAPNALAGKLQCAEQRQVPFTGKLAPNVDKSSPRRCHARTLIRALYGESMLRTVTSALHRDVMLRTARCLAPNGKRFIALRFEVPNHKRFTTARLDASNGKF